MATFNFSTITSASEFNTIFRFIHAYNKYKRENPGKTEPEIVSALIPMGFSSSLLIRAKGLGGGVVPAITDEENFVNAYKTEITNRRNTIFQ